MNHGYLSDERELLDLAAKVLQHSGCDGVGRNWNPLESNEDAFLLMVALDIHITPIDNGHDLRRYVRGGWRVGYEDQIEICETISKSDGDAPSVYREVIVKVAAKIGSTI